MLNDFLPGIVSVAILASAFAFAFVSDMRRIRRLRPSKNPATQIYASKQVETRGTTLAKSANSY